MGIYVIYNLMSGLYGSYHKIFFSILNIRILVIYDLCRVCMVTTIIIPSKIWGSIIKYFFHLGYKNLCPLQIVGGCAWFLLYQIFFSSLKYKDPCNVRLVLGVYGFYYNHIYILNIRIYVIYSLVAGVKGLTMFSGSYSDEEEDDELSRRRWEETGTRDTCCVPARLVPARGCTSDWFTRLYTHATINTNRWSSLDS